MSQNDRAQANSEVVMMLNKRILSRLSVELMITNQLTPEQKAVPGLVPGLFDNHGRGFALSVVARHDDFVSVLKTKVLVKYKKRRGA